MNWWDSRRNRILCNRNVSKTFDTEQKNIFLIHSYPLHSANCLLPTVSLWIVNPKCISDYLFLILNSEKLLCLILGILLREGSGTLSIPKCLQRNHIVSMWNNFPHPCIVSQLLVISLYSITKSVPDPFLNMLQEFSRIEDEKGNLKYILDLKSRVFCVN